LTLFRVDDPFSTRPQPVFTADGRRVAFIAGDARVVTVVPDGGFAFGRRPDRGVTDTWRVAADGKLTRLTVTPLPPAGTPRYGTAPLALSLDGTRLLLSRRESLAVVPIRGGKPTLLRALPGPALAGAWLP
jgi:hypothetical protein